MSETRIDGDNCFVCGKANPLGLKLTFRLEDEVCRSEFTPAEDHCVSQNNLFSRDDERLNRRRDIPENVSHKYLNTDSHIVFN